MSSEKISTRERMNQIKEKQNSSPRKYGNMTIGVMKRAGIGPFDLFDLTKKHPVLKDYPIDITWDKFIRLHNELLTDGPDISEDTLYSEATEVMGSVFEKIFLVEDSAG